MDLIEEILRTDQVVWQALSILSFERGSLEPIVCCINERGVLKSWARTSRVTSLVFLGKI